MRVISSARLKDFYGIYPDAESSLVAWNKIAKSAQWQNFSEIRQSFSSASQVKNFTIFNIGGNKYRLITYINFEQQMIFIRHILTHAEYDTGKWKDDPWFS